MLNTLEELKKRIEIINNLIPSFDTEERKEIKKNNKLIKELEKEMTNYKDLIFKELLIKKDKLLPKENLKEINENNTKLKITQDNISYLTNKSIFSKLKLNNNIYDLENSINLEKLNETLKTILNKFKLININLTKEDFKYSITLYKYMTNYFNYLDTTDFNTKMKETFDSLYWENPDLLIHLSLNLNLLINKYKKEFELYIKKITYDKEYSEELNKYNELKISTEKLLHTNKYLIYSSFINKELIIDDFLEESPIKKENISKITDYNQYLNMTKEAKSNFYKEIRGLNNALTEYIYIEKFKFLIEKVKEIYKNKETYKNNLNSLEKSIKSLTNSKRKNDKKLFSLYTKLETKNTTRLNNKYNELFNKSNNKITEIISLYKEYPKTLFEDEVINKLNDNSTYYDVLELYSDNYSYLMRLLKENNKEPELYNELINYLYTPNLVISKNILFANDINIKEKLKEKYSLFNINFDLEESSINTFKQTLEYINRLSYYEEEQINLQEIKVITELNKIENSGNPL